MERQRFYGAEASSGEWKAFRIPGLAHLQQEVDDYRRARIAEAYSDALQALDNIAAEVERQRAALDRKERG